MYVVKHMDQNVEIHLDTITKDYADFMTMTIDDKIY